MIRLTSGPMSPPPKSTTPMTTFTGHRKGSIASESQVALNNFNKGIKRDASAYPSFKDNPCNDTFQISFLASIKEQGLFDVADPDFDADNGDQYEKQLFIKKIIVPILFWLLLFRQTIKGRDLVKEIECDASAIISKSTNTILSQMLHNMKL